MNSGTLNESYSSPNRSNALHAKSIALVGNPNSGKTTLFNALTGSHYKVANYPGVTVEKRAGILAIGESKHHIIDLPGTYSLTGSSPDEQIAIQYLLGSLPGERPPDLVIAVVDASNLERNLYLVTELIDVGIPFVLALTMGDIAARSGITIYTELLSRHLDCPVVQIQANKKKGLVNLLHEVDGLLDGKRFSANRFAWLPHNSLFRKKSAEIGASAIEEISKGDDGRSLWIGSRILSEALNPPNPTTSKIAKDARSELSAAGFDPLSHEASARYAWINAIVQKCSVKTWEDRRSWSHRIDSLLTHRTFGLVFLFLLMTFIFQSIFLWAQIPMDLIDTACSSLGTWLGTKLPDGDLKSLLVDGVIAGVGSVLVFIPQIAVLFFFLGLLEDSGYLARAAFLMDSVMRRFGLQGRSFIPLLSSFACAIPGILSTRTIPSRADRLATILIAPLMSCSARLPVYAVLIGAFIPPTYYGGIISLQGIVLLSMYLLGVVGAAIVAWILKKTLLRREPAFFVMEMPPFRRPSLRVVLREVWDRVVLFIKSAGTIILACSIILWFLASYPKPDASHSGNPVEVSFAGYIGRTIEPAIRPLGFNWEIGVGILASFAAREVFVSSLATVYNLGEDDDSTHSLIEVFREKNAAGTITLATGLSLMVFYVFACQCISTIAVCRRETGSVGWTLLMVTYMTGIAYVASFITYRIFAGGV